MICAVTSSNAQQVFSNQGALISVGSASFLSVHGDVRNDQGGLFHNEDSIFLTDDFINNAGNQAFDTNAENGSLILYDDLQAISGSDVTHFHDLRLRGTDKKLARIDAVVKNKLFLNDLEFSLDTNTVFVENADTNAVQRSTGFVSALGIGGISRLTRSTSAYLFPVGSAIGLPIYRPVIISPANSGINRYKVRLADADATDENFDREEKQLRICYVNEAYYHQIHHLSGSESADIRFDYYPAEDGYFNGLGHWQVLPQWQDALGIKDSSSNQEASFLLENWSDFSEPAFGLILKSDPFLSADNFEIAIIGDSVQLDATGADFYQWEPADFLSCDDCPLPFAFPDSSQMFYLTGELLNGCKDFDSVFVYVDPEVQITGAEDVLFIPNAITPNNDGANDRWVIKGLERFDHSEVVIVNRWGDEVFSASPYQNDWDGKFDRKGLPEGTYYFILKVRFRDFEDVVNGPITVIR